METDNEKSRTSYSLWIEIDDYPETESTTGDSSTNTIYESLRKDGHEFTKAREITSKYTSQQLQKLEHLLRPEGLSHSGFMGAEESFTDVVRQNSIDIEEANTTFEILGSRIELVMDNWNNPILNDGNIIVTPDEGWGAQCCPFCYVELGINEEDVAMGADIIIQHTETAQTFEFSDLLGHLVKDHHFLEGSVPYHFDPKRFNEITRDVDFSKLASIE